MELVHKIVNLGSECDISAKFQISKCGAGV